MEKERFLELYNNLKGKGGANANIKLRKLLLGTV